MSFLASIGCALQRMPNIFCQHTTKETVDFLSPVPTSATAGVICPCLFSECSQKICVPRSYLNNNNVTTLPSGIFDKLTSLKNL